MFVEELQLSNFRGFEALTLRFHERLTVLVGVNGSGKTTILDALVLALPQALGAPTPIPTWQTRNGATDATIAVTYSVRRKRGVQQRTSRVSSRDARNKMVAPPKDDEQRVPVLVYFAVERRATDETPTAKESEVWGVSQAWDGHASADFEPLFRWFREREDLENQDIREDPRYRDPQLEAVRGAIVGALPGYSNPRVHRRRREQASRFPRQVLVVSKGDEDFAFDQLSEGERIVTAMVADIARRLCIANESEPLEGRGVVLIDEIELHLHPKWQVEIIPALRRTFPNLQFIVTTHSPLVLSRVPAECIRVLEDFKVHDAPGKTEGRDPNAILLEVFDTPPRPDDIREELRVIGTLLDGDRFDDARARLDALAERLGEQDSEVTRLRTMLSVLAS